MAYGKKVGSMIAGPGKHMGSSKAPKGGRRRGK